MKLKCILVSVLLLWQTISAKAQLCPGGLGDPIVNITFGSGPNPGPPLSAATTNYQYNATQCPNDGLYAVVNQTNACFNNSWLTLTADHTGNTNGYFMVVNASYQPSAFYVETVNLICSNTTYEFAAWILNLSRPTGCSNNPIQPNLTFNIEQVDGTVLKTYNTGNIPPLAGPEWKQHGFFFDLPANISKVVVRIINNAPGGCGNDLALDDITFRPCGPLVKSSIEGNESTVSLCEETSKDYTLLSDISTGFTNPFVQWQQSVNGSAWTDIPGANDLKLVQNFPTNKPVGRYQYRVAVSKVENQTIAICRINSPVLTVNVVPKPITSATVNSPLCAGATGILTASGGSQYQWTGAGGFSANTRTVLIPNTLPSNSGMYYVSVSNSDGCIVKDSVRLQVNPRPTAVVDITEANICEGEKISLNASGGIRYQWLPAKGLSANNIANPIASPDETINYSAVVSNSFSCSDTASVRISVSKKPRADAGADRLIISGGTAQLSGTASGTNISFSWSPQNSISNATTLTPSVNPVTDTKYFLTVTSGDGCGEAIDSVKVSFFKGIYVPTAFTPNNDGLNDKWHIPALPAFSDYEVSVFNRYGQVVFYSRNSDVQWDGKFKGHLLPTGTYPYLIHVRDLSLVLKGLVLIVR